MKFIQKQREREKKKKKNSRKKIEVSGEILSDGLFNLIVNKQAFFDFEDLGERDLRTLSSVGTFYLLLIDNHHNHNHNPENLDDKNNNKSSLSF